MKDIFLVVLVVILIWALWFFGGKPSPNGTSGLSFFGTNISSPSAGATSSPSIFKDEVRISDISSARESDINREHIGITAAYGNGSSVSLTGWKLKNKNGQIAQIGKASKLPYSGRANTEEPFYVAPGETVVVATGRSPVGVSFKINSCSGYLGQFQVFNPPLPASCPNNVDDARASHRGLEEQCLSYIAGLPSCSIYTGALPSNLSSVCANYIRGSINYNGCADLHRNDQDFYKTQWRVFLGENDSLWNNAGDFIRLYDQHGNLVDSRSY